MKIYHFCASHQNNSGVLHFIDGVLSTDLNFINKGAYDTFKDDIGKIMVPPHEGKELVLLSLTVIENI